MVTEAINNPNLTTPNYYEDYTNQYFNLKDGQYSPDKTHYCRYAGFGTIKTVGLSTGLRALYMKPAIPTPDIKTRACSVVIPKYYNDFEWEVWMATLSQTSPWKENWEAAWLFFHQTDQSHHYYLYIQKSGRLELGKKDMEKWEERQIFLKTTDPIQSGFVFKKWYNVKIRMEGFHIQVWVDGVKYIDIIDNGKIGNFGSVQPHPPSTQIGHGFCGYYCEDSEVLFTKSKIVPILKPVVV